LVAMMFFCVGTVWVWCGGFGRLTQRAQGPDG
jgi:hypothetical protein